jgi:hypothetical protein
VAITAGAAASSTALIGFVLDSVIQVSSAAAVAWQSASRDPEAREQVTLRAIAVSFFALAGYVTVESARALSGHTEPHHSTIGIVLAAVSLAVMPGLSWAQRRAGRELGSRTAAVAVKEGRDTGAATPAAPATDAAKADVTTKTTYPRTSWLKSQLKDLISWPPCPPCSSVTALPRWSTTRRGSGSSKSWRPICRGRGRS